jgi:hypothetical protein
MLAWSDLLGLCIFALMMVGGLYGLVQMCHQHSKFLSPAQYHGLSRNQRKAYQLVQCEECKRSLGKYGPICKGGYICGLCDPNFP